jgi:hypothetical protein
MDQKRRQAKRREAAWKGRNEGQFSYKYLRERGTESLLHALQAKLAIACSLKAPGNDFIPRPSGSQLGPGNLGRFLLHFPFTIFGIHGFASADVGNELQEGGIASQFSRYLTPGKSYIRLYELTTAQTPRCLSRNDS